MANFITIDEYKALEGITSGTEDEKLEILIPSVSQLVKTYCANSIIDFSTSAKTELFTVDYNSHILQLTESPLIAITSVRVKESIGNSFVALASTDYNIDKKTDSVIRISGSKYRNWPKGPEAVEVVYTAGYTTTPLDLKLAVADLVTYYLRDEHKPRQSLSGATRETTENEVRVGFPAHIRRVLDLYRLIL